MKYRNGERKTGQYTTTLAGKPKTVQCNRQNQKMEEEDIQIWLLLKQCTPTVYQHKIPVKRQLSILDGKAKIIFKDDFEMTTEELLGLQ